MSDDSSEPQSREQFWRMHIEQARAMGMRYTEYARQHDLNLGTLYSWSKRFRQSGCNKADHPTFAKVQILDQAGLPAACRCHFPNGVILELDAPRDTAVLGQFLTLLSRLP